MSHNNILNRNYCKLRKLKRRQKKIDDNVELDDIENYSLQNFEDNQNSFDNTIKINDSFTNSNEISNRVKKIAKTFIFFTSNRQFIQRLKKCKAFSSTFNSQNHLIIINNIIAQSQRSQFVFTSSFTLCNIINKINVFENQKSNLIMIVLKLIHFKIFEFNVFTKLKLRHKIDFVLNVNQIKLRKYKETISKLYKKFNNQKQNFEKIYVSNRKI